MSSWKLTLVEIEKKNKTKQKKERKGNPNGQDVPMDGLPVIVCYARVWRAVNTLNAGSGGRGSSFSRRVVSLDEELYSTLN